MEIDIKLLFVPGVVIFGLFFAFLLKPKNPIRTLSVKLVDKRTLTHDTIIFTFLLPNPKRAVGLEIGEHIELEYI